MSMHTLRDSLTNPRAFPILVALLFTAIIIFFQRFFQEKLEKYGYTSNTTISGEKELPNFFDAIKISHVEEVLEEDEMLEKTYGVKVNLPSMISRLRSINYTPNHPVNGLSWYSILSNPRYRDEFAYISPYESGRYYLLPKNP